MPYSIHVPKNLAGQERVFVMRARTDWPPGKPLTRRSKRENPAQRNFSVDAKYGLNPRLRSLSPCPPHLEIRQRGHRLRLALRTP